MNDIIIGKGNLANKGIYANRGFGSGETVINYILIELTEKEFKELPESEKQFTHTHWGKIYLYSGLERYINHHDNPNTYQDLKNRRDVAIRNIKKGEMITTNAIKDNVE